jgi:hypothetical protein
MAMSILPLWEVLVPALPPQAAEAGLDAAPLPAAMALDRTAPGQASGIVAGTAPAELPDRVCWLDEISFLPGARVTVTARSASGGDLLAERIGPIGLRAAAR